jgi:hypothetical protein
MKSNSNGKDPAFRASAWKLHHKLASKTSQFYAEFDAFIGDVGVVFEQLRTVLPAHEIDNLKGKLHPAAIESTCKVVLRTAERVEEFWTARPQSLAHEATPRNSVHDPEPDSQATPSWTKEAVDRRNLTPGVVRPSGCGRLDIGVRTVVIMEPFYRCASKPCGSKQTRALSDDLRIRYTVEPNCEPRHLIL